MRSYLSITLLCQYYKVFSLDQDYSFRPGLIAFETWPGRAIMEVMTTSGLVAVAKSGALSVALCSQPLKAHN
jgi:hypothetical protein